MTDDPGWALDPDQASPTWTHPEFPGWYAWKGVGDVGYYARRPRSSPPKVVGPLPALADIGPEIDRRNGGHQAPEKPWGLADYPRTRYAGMRLIRE